MIYNAADGRRFLSDRPTARALLALTPLSAHALKGSGLPILDGNTGYGDYAQARLMVFRERIRADWRQALIGADAPSATEWFVLDLAFATLLHGFHRLRHAAGPDGPWLVPGKDGWTRHETRLDAAIAASRHVTGHYWSFLGNIVSSPVPFPHAYRLARAFLVRLGRARRPAWVTTRSDHPLNLERALFRAAPGARQWHVATADGGWREYARLAREAFRAATGHGQVQLRAVPRAPEDSRRRAARAIEAMPDAEMRALLRAFAPEIVALCAIAGGAHRDIREILRGLRPNFQLSSETADAITAALFEACGEAGIPRRLASHNSFGPAQGRLNAMANLHQIGHQYAEGIAEQMMFWNRPSWDAARQAFPATAHRCLPIEATAVRAPEARPARPFHVLHATNSMRYFSRPAWIFESVNEFATGVVALIEAGLAIEDTTYMVRTKSRRHEIDEDSLRAMLPPSERVEIAFRHTRPFAEDLARADLLVAFRSTTIMQALYARKPVLLWGITPRYRELNGRETPPTSGDRAAVYSVRRAEVLGPMLAGIRNAHRGAPLTDEELAPYLVPPSAMTVDQWARTCLAPRSA